MDTEQNTETAAEAAPDQRPASASDGQEASESAGREGSFEPDRIDVILASGSPRRRQLLEEAGVRFTVRVSEADETLDADLLAEPVEAAKKLAERKAGAVVQEVLASDYRGAAVVLGADTMVVLDNTIFGKPKSLSDAKGMLRKLSGNTHEVHTAVSVWMVMAPEPEKVSLGFRTFCDTSRVAFKELTDDEIAAYLKCGESFDKAGAYAIQGEGAKLATLVEGELDTVIGLPVTRLLKEFPDIFA